MPQLPTLTVTDAQATRLLAAFGTSAAYKEWLKNRLIEYVVEAEAMAERVSIEQNRVSQLNQLKSEISSQ